MSLELPEIDALFREYGFVARVYTEYTDTPRKKRNAEKRWESGIHAWEYPPLRAAEEKQVPVMLDARIVWNAWNAHMQFYFTHGKVSEDGRVRRPKTLEEVEELIRTYLAERARLSVLWMVRAGDERLFPIWNLSDAVERGDPGTVRVVQDWLYENGVPF